MAVCALVSVLVSVALSAAFERSLVNCSSKGPTTAARARGIVSSSWHPPSDATGSALGVGGGWIGCPGQFPTRPNARMFARRLDFIQSHAPHMSLPHSSHIGNQALGAAGDTSGGT